MTDFTALEQSEPHRSHSSVILRDCVGARLQLNTTNGLDVFPEQRSEWGCKAQAQQRKFAQKGAQSVQRVQKIVQLLRSKCTKSAKSAQSAQRAQKREQILRKNFPPTTKSKVKKKPLKKQEKTNKRPCKHQDLLPWRYPHMHSWHFDAERKKRGERKGGLLHFSFFPSFFLTPHFFSFSFSRSCSLSLISS